MDINFKALGPLLFTATNELRVGLINGAWALLPCGAASVLSVMLLAPLPLGGTALAASPEMVIVVASQIAPKMFTKEDGVPTGYITDLAVEIVKRAGYTPVVKALPWARAIKTVEDGEGVIPGFSKSPERDANFNYSDVMSLDEVQIVTLKSANLTIENADDLKGHRVGFQLGSTFGPAFDKILPLVEQVTDGASDLRLRKLAAGRIDVAIMTGGMIGLHYNAKQAEVDMASLKVHSPPLAINPAHFGISKSRPDQAEVLKKINAAIAAVNSDGSAAKILAAWE